MKKNIIILVLFLVAVGIYLAPYVKLNKNGKDPSAEQISVKEDPSSFYTIKEIKSDKSMKTLGLTVDNFPIIDGATSTQPIRSLIGCTFFKGQCTYWYETEARDMFLAGWIDYPEGVAFGSAEFKKYEALNKNLAKNSKTHDAYVDLMIARSDLILVSTKPSDDELEMARKLGVKMELTPVGLDGFVFLVNQENKVKNLSTQNIRDIYSGKIKNWKQLTGLDQPIKALTRQQNSGSQELMQKLVMKDTIMDKTLQEEQVVQTMGGLIDEIGFDSKSLGYSLYYYKNNMIDKREVRPEVKLLSIDGVEPNPANIIANKYPYVFNVYAVTRSDQPINSPAYQLKEWLTGKEGQEIIKKAGYIGLYQ